VYERTLGTTLRFCANSRSSGFRLGVEYCDRLIRNCWDMEFSISGPSAPLTGAAPSRYLHFGRLKFTGAVAKW
jgi:hypothetical protein